MKRLVAALWRDESGFILSSELVLVGSIVVLGGLTALTAVRDAVSGEFTDVANAVGNMDQSYYYQGQVGQGRYGRVKAWTAGSAYLDPEHREKYAESELQIPARPEIPAIPPVPTPAPPIPDPTLFAPGGPILEAPCPTGDCGSQWMPQGEYVPTLPHFAPSPPPSLQEVWNAYGYNARYGYAGPRPIVPDPPVRPAFPPTSVPFVW